jgi:sigma-B regulation protein RsbU (phosphoserine phosphatase)
MAVTKALLKSRASEDHAPGSILTHVNDEISHDNEASMFVTVFLAILDLETGALSYVNAGHNPPYIKRQNGDLVRLDERHGPVIGAVKGLTYGDSRNTLSLSDQLLLFTDGVTEAMNREVQLYGEPRLVRLLESRNFKSPEDLVRTTGLDVQAFEGGADPADDMTILGVQYFGGRSADESALVLVMDTRRHRSEIERVKEEFNTFARARGVPDHTRGLMNAVFDELVSNIVSHAFTGTEAHEISIQVELRGPRLDVTTRDSGVRFDPVGATAQNVTLWTEEGAADGLGIRTVADVMDEVSYARVDAENVVRLVKYLGN